MTIDYVKAFKKQYPSTLCWRLNKHAKLIDENLADGEIVTYAFAAQNNASHGDIFDTAVLAITNKRLLIAQDRILIGYKFNSVTPDLYNDLQIHAGILWGGLTIDTVKETIEFSNISKKALSEIQKSISALMIEAKYKKKDKKNS